MIRIRLEERGHPARFTEILTLPATLGRAPSNDIVIDRPFVSARHGELYSAGDQVFYADLGSTNGSRLERRGETTAIRAGTSHANPIRDGDRIILGEGDQTLVMLIESTTGIRTDDRAVPPTVVAARRPVGGPHEGAHPVSLAGKLAHLAKRAALVRQVDDLDRLMATTCLEVFPSATHVMLAESPDPPCEPWEPGRVLARGAARFEAGPPPSPTAREAMQRHEALLVTDTNLPSTDAPPLRVAAVRAMIAVPVLHGRVGVIQVESRDQPHAFTEADLDVLMLLGGQYSAVRLRLQRESSLQARCVALAEANRHLEARGHPELFAGPDLQRFLDTLDPVLDTDVTVLVTGETGTGKELVARYLHGQGPRSRETFWAINCAALSDNLLQDELFGHVKGAFTGAEGPRKGIFELAHGGTLFLDEVGELGESVQAKLLRVIETGEVWRLGSERPIRVSTRIIAATNRDLRQEVERGRFRADLYYRLAVFLAPVPPLRLRQRDIIPLAEHLIARLTGLNRAIRMRDDVKKTLVGYSWPGNVRELRNELERVTLRLGRSRSVVEASDLSIPGMDAHRLPASNGRAPNAATITIPEGGMPLEQLEREIFEHTLRMFDGQQTKAAKALGMKYTTFRFRAKRVGVL